MSAAWDVIRRALSDATTDLFTVLASNLFWLVGNALVITGPPATLALFYVANRLARGEVTDPGDFIAAFRRYFKPAWRWGLLNLLVVFFLVGDFVITGRLLDPPLSQLIQGFYLQALLFWLFLQLYLLPFLLEQEQPQVRLALRNALVMFGRNLSFSLALALLVVFVLIGSTIFFLVIFAAGGMLMALIGNHAVLNRLEGVREA